jgi:hypothetical protein
VADAAGARDLEFVLVDEATFDEIPAPARPGARCQTCDYWERLDGGREAPDPTDGRGQAALAAGKRGRLLAGRELAGAYGMLAYRVDSVERHAIGWCQFGPLSAYPRAQVIRDRYPELPESPAPWVVTCLQVRPESGDPEVRRATAAALLGAVCDELDRRGITAVEAYPERAADPWDPSPGPAVSYVDAGFERSAGDDRYPVYRRELAGGADLGWGDLLERARPPADADEWPLRAPPGPSEADFFRLPPDKPKRPNPFGED